MRILGALIWLFSIPLAFTACGGSSSNSGANVAPVSLGSSSTVDSIPKVPSSISFVSATPTSIGLKGMGGAGVQETSTIKFKVLDLSGAPLANQIVDFALNTNIGGISLIATSGTTAADGTVSTIVQAGTIATSIKVTASVRGASPAIITQSDQLVVSTGVPAQDGFSVSVETLNTESFGIDGVTTNVTARVSDHFHNPVPDGTAVYFTTSGGSIKPSCVTVGGACTVVWTSQNPRPTNGRARILAYAIGEETFIDLNGNGLADNATEFTDTSEAFRDDNENGVKDTNETFIDFNGDGQFNGPDGLYNGVLQGTAYATAPKSKHVFSNTTLVMSTSAASIVNSCGDSTTVAQLGSRTCVIRVSDLNSNVMPAGTTVAFTYTKIVDGITLTSDTYTFPNSSGSGTVSIPVTLTDASVAPAPAGRGILKTTVTSPKGLVTQHFCNIN